MKKIRFFHASASYPAFVQSIYSKNVELASASYLIQLETILAGRFGWSNFWGKNLVALGDYEVEQVITNAKNLQKQWAVEHSVRVDPKAWASQILLAQIRAFKPDVVFIQDTKLITPLYLAEIRKQAPSVRLIILWDGIAENNAAKFKGVDLVLSCLESVAQYYRSEGLDAYLMPMCFDSTILRELPKLSPKQGVSFVGGVSLFEGGHYGRVQLLSKLIGSIDLKVWLAGSIFKQSVLSSLVFLKRSKPAQILLHLETLSGYWKLISRSRGTLFGLDMYQTLAESSITINSHVDVASNKAANMRLFEATGVGTCLVTDWKDNLSDYFEPEKEVVTYRSPEECLEKVQWLLKHPDECEKIAKAGQARTLRDHTFRNRAELLDQIIRANLSAG